MQIMLSAYVENWKWIRTFTKDDKIKLSISIKIQRYQHNNFYTSMDHQVQVIPFHDGHGSDHQLSLQPFNADFDDDDTNLVCLQSANFNTNQPRLTEMFHRGQQVRVLSKIKPPSPDTDRMEEVE